MKKLLVLMLALCLVVTCFAGCGKDAEKTDLDYVKEKGTLVVGITDFAPMDYQDADGNWIGFDADMAKAFAKELGVEVKFQIIDWDSKVMELDGKTIDVVWNGMTLTDAVKNSMATSNPYCNNQQVVIVKKDVADKYQTVDSVKNLKFAVEAGSAGATQAKALSQSVTEVTDQATALTEVKSGTADAAVIDSLMAAAMVGEGTGFSELTYTVGLNDEEYGVGFRKGSNLAEELNKFFKKAYADGTMQATAEKYGVQAALIEQK
jgi:polar amino acid transport system substrate-binding protein